PVGVSIGGGERLRGTQLSVQGLRLVGGLQLGRCQACGRAGVGSCRPVGSSATSLRGGSHAGGRICRKTRSRNRTVTLSVACGACYCSGVSSGGLQVGTDPIANRGTAALAPALIDFRQANCRGGDATPHVGGIASKRSAQHLSAGADTRTAALGDKQISLPLSRSVEPVRKGSAATD